MSGILEQIHQGLQQVLQNQSTLHGLLTQIATAQAQAPAAPAAPAMGGMTLAAAPAAPAAPAMGGLGGLSLGGPAPAAPAVPANVTGDQLMALITPHLDNAAVKEALSVAMKNCGVNALPEAQPAQYPALYAAFQQVIAQHAGAQSAAPQTNTAII